MLEKLNSNYSSRGLEILPFQCSQFLNHGPGTDLEISNSLKFVRPGGGYEPAFGPIFSKVDVNGADAHPLWKKLRSSCPLTPGGILQPVGYPPIAWTPITTSDVQWNFEKILWTLSSEDGEVSLFLGAVFLPSQTIDSTLLSDLSLTKMPQLSPLPQNRLQR